MSHENYVDLAELTAAIRKASGEMHVEDDVWKIRNGKVPYQPGTDGQFLTLYLRVEGLMEGVKRLGYSTLLIHARDKDYPIACLHKNILVTDRHIGHFLGNCGLEVFACFAASLKKLICETTDRGKIIKALDAMSAYVEQTSAKLYHLMPNYLAKEHEEFKYDPDNYVPLPKDLSQKVTVDRGRKIALAWARVSQGKRELVCTTTAFLADEVNPEVTQQIYDSLQENQKIEVNLDQAGISGCSVYGTIELKITAEARKKEPLNVAESGRIRATVATGCKWVVQTAGGDLMREDVPSVVIGQTCPEDISQVEEIGRKIMENTFLRPAEQCDFHLTVTLV